MRGDGALVVVCRRPGLIRAGIRHPAVAEYPAADFSAEQLAEMLAEPELTLVIGRLMTEADITRGDASALDDAAPGRRPKRAS